MLKCYIFNFPVANLNFSESRTSTRIGKTRPEIPRKNVDGILNNKTKMVKRPRVPSKKGKQSKESTRGLLV